MPFGGAAVGDMYSCTYCSLNVIGQALFLYRTRWSAWWTISCHNRGVSGFLPSSLLWLAAGEGGKEGWL